jgi:hypothetical protein
MLGFLGDKIGLKPVLLTSIIGMAVCGTCIDLTPRYKEYNRHSTALVTRKNNSSGNFILRSVQWPIDYPNCSTLESKEMESCENAPPVVNPHFFDNISDYLICKDTDRNSVQIKSLDTSFLKYPLGNGLSILDMPGNGTFCDLYTNYIIDAEEENIYCEIIEYPDAGSCFDTKGSHTAMLFTYLFIRISLEIFDKTTYGLLYGTAMHLVKEHNGDFSMVVVWNYVAGMISPLIAGTLVVFSDDPSGNK